MDLKESQLDLEELKQLLTQAKRVTVQELIKKQIRHIEVEIEQVEQAAKKEQEKQQKQQQEVEIEKTPIQKVVVEQPKNLKFLTLTRYTWDQSRQNVSVQVYLDDLSKVDPQNVKVTFNTQSFDIKVFDLKGINYQFAIPKLQDKIKVTESKYILKSSYISIKLKMAEKGHWNQLAYKEDALKKSQEENLDNPVDPSKSLMDVVKNLYESGDDNMKKVIAESFSKSQNKQANGFNPKDTFGGDDEDF